MGSRVTALEIEEQEFGRRLRGYDVQEVKLYLQSVAEEIERLNLENGNMREQAGQIRDELERARSREVSLQQTLITAQRVTEEMKERARAESDLTVREARQRRFATDVAECQVEWVEDADGKDQLVLVRVVLLLRPSVRLPQFSASHLRCRCARRSTTPTANIPTLLRAQD